MALQTGQPIADAFDEIAAAVTTTIAPVLAMDGCSARLLDLIESAVEDGVGRSGRGDGADGEAEPPPEIAV